MFSPGRRRVSREDVAGKPHKNKKRIAEYHKSRRWVEKLETRQLLSDASFAGLNFHLATDDSTTDANLTDLFANGTGASHTSVTYTGNINGFSQNVTGTFDITAVSATTFTIAATNLGFSRGDGLAQVSGGTASFNLNSTGFSGSISTPSAFNLGSVGNLSVSLSALSLAWNTGSGDNNVILGATGSLTITTGQSLASGTLSFESSGSDVTVGVSGASVSLGSGVVSVSNLNASLTLSTGGIQGSGSASISAMFTSNNATFSGTFGFSVDTTSGSSDQNLQITGTGVHITVGGFTMTADIAIEQSSSNSAVVAAELSNMTVDFTDGTTDFVHIVTPSSGSSQYGAFFFENGSFAGVIEGTATITGAGGVSAGVTADLLINSGSHTFSFTDPINTMNQVTIPAGPLVQVYLAGTTVHLSGSQTVTGDFGFAYGQDSNNVTDVVVTAANVAGTFGSTSFSNCSASLTINGSGISGTITGTAAFSSGGVSVASGAFSVTVGNSSFSLSGTNVVLNVLGQQLSGSFTVSAGAGSTTFTITDATLLFGGGVLSADNLSGSFTVSGGSTTGTVSATINTSIGSAAFAGAISIGFGASTMTLNGTSDTLTVGDQSISGSFTITQSGSNVAISASNVTASLGGGLVSVTNGSFSATLSSGSVTATASGTVAAGSGVTGVSFSGPLTVSVSPTAITASGTGDSFTVAGQTFTAGFSFSEDSNGLELGISGVSMSLAGGALAITNASGNLLVLADDSGISGSVSASFTSNVAHFSGNVEVDFGGGTVTMNATDVSLSVGDQSISGDLGITVNGSEIDFTATDVSASLGGGLVTIGPPPAGTSVPASTLKIVGGVASGTFSGVVSAGTASGVGFSGLVTVTVDQSGGITASGTNDTLTIAGQAITANFSFAESSGNLQLTVSGVSFALGSVLSVSNAGGTLSVTSSGISGSASGTITKGIADLSGDLGLSFSPGVIEITGTSDSLSYGDQSISGSFSFTKDSTGLHLSSSNLSASLGGGLVTVNNGTASLNVDQTSGVITGSFSGDIATGGALTSAGVSFSGQLSVAVGGGSIQASGNNDSLTVLGQTFTTNFKFFEDASGLELNVSGLSFSLGGLLSVAGASGTLLVNSSGVSGSTAGSVTSAAGRFQRHAGRDVWVGAIDGERHGRHVCHRRQYAGR